MEDVTDTIRELVIANRILAREGVVDAFGHISVRNPNNRESYFISVSRAPELITIDDIVEFRLDGEPIGDLKERTPYGERAIHGGIYELRQDVNSVVHNHSQEVVPFASTNTLIRPLLHMSAPIGATIPIWDIRDKFGETNHLVVTMEQGRDLATTLGNNASALMKRHGCVCARRNIREVVMTAVAFPIAVPLPNAKKAADRSSMAVVRDKHPVFASCPAASANGPERLPGQRTKWVSPLAWKASSNFRQASKLERAIDRV